MYKNLNKFLTRFSALFIIIFSFLILYDYFSTKNKIPEIKTQLTITNSIQSTLLSTYFSVNIENSRVFNKFFLRKINAHKFQLSYISKNKKEKQEKKIEILKEVEVLKDEISEDILFLINLNKGEFLLNSEIAVVYSVITSGKDFLTVTENENVFNTFSKIRYIYYIFVSLIISILLLLIIKQINIHKSQINKLLKNLI